MVRMALRSFSTLVGTLSTAALALASTLACGKSPSASAPSAAWPNEPAGLRVVADWGFDQVPPTSGDVPIPGSPGWSVVYGTPSEPLYGTVGLGERPPARRPPTHRYTAEYPQGMVEGTAPTTVYFPRSLGGIEGRLK